MMQWVLATYAVFVLAVGAGAALVALLVPEDEPDRRKTGFRILKLSLGASTGVTGLGTLAPLATQLAEAGLM